MTCNEKLTFELVCKYLNLHIWMVRDNGEIIGYVRRDPIEPVLWEYHFRFQQASSGQAKSGWKYNTRQHAAQALKREVDRIAS